MTIRSDDRHAALQAVIDAIDEAVLLFDAAGRVEAANEAASALFAGRPVESWDDLLSRLRTTASAPEAAVPSARLEPDAGPVEVTVGDRPGRWAELRTYRVPATDTDGRDLEPRRIAILRDISAARRARARSQAILGVLSHELRTPITTIYAGSKILARHEPLDERARDLAVDISLEAERLFRLVEDLLVLTRSDRGVLNVHREPVLLRHVVESAVRLESTAWPTARIAVTATPNLPAVAGDPASVEHVVRNLVSNAARYSPSPPVVDIRLEAVDDGAAVACRILDRGPGLAAEDDDVFELAGTRSGTAASSGRPATSGPASAGLPAAGAAQAAGAGIGLFVCRRLIDAMGGRIWARGRSGGGAELGFALPRFDER